MDNARSGSSALGTSPSRGAAAGTSLPDASRRRGAATIAHRSLLALCLLAGIAAHLRVWAAGRGFWNDELAIALNLRRPAERLAGGLMYHQVAPLGWLRLEKALFDHVSDSERVLRLPSLLGAIAVLVLTALLAYRILGRWTGLLATTLVAGAPTLQQYAGELKQYAVEAAVALSLLLLVDQLGRRTPGSARRRWLLAAATAVPAALLMFFSYPGVLVLAGAAGGLAAWLAHRRRWADLATLVVSVIPAVALSTYLIRLRLSHSLMPGQQTYFEWGMPVPGSGVIGVLEWLPRMWVRFVEMPMGLRLPVLVLALVVAGLVGLTVRGRSRYAAMLLGALTAAVAAAAAQGLPVVDRVATYLVAPTLILVAAGVDAVVRAIRWLLRRRVPWTGPGSRQVGNAAVAVLASVLAAAVAGPALVAVARETARPGYRDAGREALADVAGRIRPGDLVVLYWFSDKLGRWYGDRYGVDSYLRARLRPRDGGRCPSEELDGVLAGYQRVWYVRGVRLSLDPDDFTRRVVGQLAAYGSVVDSRFFGTADGTPDDGADGLADGPGWVLIDLTADPDPAPPVTPPDPERACLVLGTD